MKLLNFTIVKLTFCLIVGIAITYAYNVSFATTLYLSGAFLVVLFIVFLIARKEFIKTPWFGVLAFATMISVGMLIVNLHNQKNASSHYSHFISNKNDSLKTITFRIREVLKPGNYYDKYVMDILELEGLNVSGKSLLNIQKDSLQPSLKVDSIFVVKAIFKDLIPALNPYQFDYKTYLGKQYIYHQLFAKNPSLFKVSSQKHTLFGIANNIREHINLKLKPYPFQPDELAIINALLLGQRQDISKDVYTRYANAGAIHILAVSGLHIGIILLLLSTIFKPIERFKHGKLIKTILLVIILWGFAIIAGLSASVVRAVTMFSIIAIAINYKRPTNIYNTLAISIFVILLFKPMFLFDVGFQLSYLAVLGIVAIDPLFYKLWKPKFYIIDTFWHTLTVTVSAQFGIIPISLFYFHQFPSLLFISNLVIIPVLGIILAFGIVIILLALLNVLPSFLAALYGNIIGLMNNFVGWIAQQEIFLFKDIAFGVLYVLVSYGVIFALFRLSIKRNFANVRLLLTAIIITQIAVLYTIYNVPKNEFIVFHKSRNSLIGNVFKNAFMVAHDFDSITEAKNNIIKNYTVGNHIKTIKKDSLQSLYILNKKRVLVLDSLGIYNIKSFRPDYVLLRQSPKINLNRLIDSIKPKYIIADGSNYKSYIEQWKKICIKRKLPFHQTGKKGAFIIDY